MDATTTIGRESVGDAFVIINQPHTCLEEKVRQIESQIPLIRRFQERICYLLHLSLGSQSDRSDDCLSLLFEIKYAIGELESLPDNEVIGHAFKHGGSCSPWVSPIHN